MRSPLAAAAVVAMASVLAVPDALAQKSGGTLRVTHRDSPANMSIHENGTVSVAAPIMSVFNNLVLYDQTKPQNTIEGIVPDLATAWKWSEDNKRLTFKLRQGVKWHDGKPFTSADVKCTWDVLAERGKEKLRINSRKGWYANLESVTTNGDFEVSFNLGRPQPALLALLASGFSPVYPCHVSVAQMRQHPIGTGPFKFVEYKNDQGIKVVRNPDYWKPGRPYLDAIEWTIIKNRSTAILAFVSGQHDMFFPYELTVPLIGDVKAKLPEAVCELAPLNVAANLLMNPNPPFDNIEVRRAVAMTIDRKVFIDIMTQGKGDVGGAMQPGPEGRWGLPPEVLEKEMPGYHPDVEASREKARKVIAGLGYGPDKMLKLKLSTRNIPTYRDASVILIDQLRKIFIDAELELVETAQWVPRLIKREYQFALSQVGNGVDDPDQHFPEYYQCGARTYMDYCNKEVDEMIVRQSSELDPAKRRELAWALDRKITGEAVRPMIYFMRGANCWRPEVKGITIMVNSIYNGWRFEDAWLDR